MKTQTIQVDTQTGENTNNASGHTNRRTQRGKDDGPSTPGPPLPVQTALLTELEADVGTLLVAVGRGEKVAHHISHW